MLQHYTHNTYNGSCGFLHTTIHTWEVWLSMLQHYTHNTYGGRCGFLHTTFKGILPESCFYNREILIFFRRFVLQMLIPL